MRFIKLKKDISDRFIVYKKKRRDQEKNILEKIILNFFDKIKVRVLDFAVVSLFTFAAWLNVRKKC